ncbi:MAG TPA: T9SS type A sorting domain-containing protein [Ignavibacteriaceae bacterium]|nr:T9SS type A sorting domain-containing protein [Ignavibacteriaceae bacterium]
MKKIIIFFMCCVLTSLHFAQIDTLDFKCFYTTEDSIIQDYPGIPFTGTTNMVIVLCVEQGQSKIVDIAQFLSPLKDNLEDYFNKATFENYSVNVLDFLVESIDPGAGIATVFELPDTILLQPPTPSPGMDTSFVVQPWMVRNVLAQADAIYDFNNYDTDNDGIVDFLAFVLIRFREGGMSTGTPGLSIDEEYTTNDLTPGGQPVKIDGNGYGSANYEGHRSIIERKWDGATNVEVLTGITVHELGHALFDFPDMYLTKLHYALGQFCPMAGGGFNGRVSLYNPVLRISKGWVSPEPITANTTITFSDFDLTSNTNFYALPNYAHSPRFFFILHDQKFYLSYYTKPASIRWQSNWPIPKSQTGEHKGILIWHTRPWGNWNIRYTFPINIQSAHGKWDWIQDRADTLNAPYDRRAIRSDNENPLYGFDSLEVKYSYLWQKFDSGNYEWQSTYPDWRVGSETCFFNPLSPQEFSMLSNPNSNANAWGTQFNWGRITPSGLRMKNLRLDGQYVKADIIIGDEANTITENATLPKGKWGFISDLTISAGVTLTITAGTELHFFNGSKLIVNGTLIAQGTQSQKIILNFWDNQISGITVRNGGTLNLDYCQVKNASTGISTFHAANTIIVNHCNFENITGNAISVGSNTQKLEVYNSTFDNCGSYCINIFGPIATTTKIYTNIFQNTDYGVLVSSVNSLIIHSNTFSDVQLGISAIQVSDAHIIGNNLFSSQALNSGIFFNNSNGYIRQNVINGFKRGISIANSAPKVGENQLLFNNVNGIYASVGSIPDLRLFLGVSQTPGCPPYYYALSGCNEVSDNGGYTQIPMEVGDDGSEIFLSNSYILMDIGNNKIVDDRAEIPPLYHTQLLMNGTSSQEEQIMARYNWWGFNEISSRRFGSLDVTYIPTGADNCPVPIMQPCTLIVNSYNELDGLVAVDTLYPLYSAEDFSNLDEEFALADKYYLEGDFSNASIAYKNIIEDYPDSIQTSVAGSQLLNILSIQNADYNNYSELQTFYNSYVSNVSDSLLLKIIENLNTLCYIGKEEFETAIGRFEDIIIQNPGEEEAIYAEIDAITAAMLANGGGGNLGKYSGKYVSTSLDEYGNKIGDLIAKLGSSGSQENNETIIPAEYKLYQNYPNPFNPVTTIKYDIVKAQDVKLAVYDILGREVVSLVNAQQQPGSYEVNWDASGFASGIYFYTLTSGDFISTKKLILLK